MQLCDHGQKRPESCMQGRQHAPELHVGCSGREGLLTFTILAGFWGGDATRQGGWTSKGLLLWAVRVSQPKEVGMGGRRASCSRRGADSGDSLAPYLAGDRPRAESRLSWASPSRLRYSRLRAFFSAAKAGSVPGIAIIHSLSDQDTRSSIRFLACVNPFCGL